MWLHCQVNYTNDILSCFLVSSVEFEVLHGSQHCQMIVWKVVVTTFSLWAHHLVKCWSREYWQHSTGHHRGSVSRQRQSIWWSWFMQQQWCGLYFFWAVGTNFISSLPLTQIFVEAVSRTQVGGVTVTFFCLFHSSCSALKVGLRLQFWIRCSYWFSYCLVSASQHYDWVLPLLLEMQHIFVEDFGQTIRYLSTLYYITANKVSG